MRFKWGKSFPFTQAILQLFPKHVETKGALGEPKKTSLYVTFVVKTSSARISRLNMLMPVMMVLINIFLYKTDGDIGS